MTIDISNLDKEKRQILKNSIFNGPLIVNQTFSQTECIIQVLHILCIFIKPSVWYLWCLKIMAIKRWLISVQFCKNFTEPPFYGGWTKKLQTFTRHFFWEQPSKYCIAEFTAIFLCLLLSWSRRYSMNWSSNFDGP